VAGSPFEYKVQGSGRGNLEISQWRAWNKIRNIPTMFEVESEQESEASFRLSFKKD